MNDVQKSRYDRFFDAYEDAEGYLTRSSLLAHVDALAEVRGTPPVGPAMNDLRSQMSGTWDLIAGIVDTNADGRISREEFYAAGRTLTDFILQAGDSTAESPLVPWIRALFAVIDANGDGRITKDEYIDWLTALGLAADTDIDAAFAGFDKNDDNSLSDAEFAECGRQFWSVFDAAVPGHRWIGP